MRGRVLILIGAIILLVVVVAAVFLMNGGDDTANDGADGATTEVADGSADGTTGTGGEAGGPVVGQIENVNIVIAYNDLPRGFRITEDSLASDSPPVGLYPWPRDALPTDGSYYTDPAELVNKIARTDLIRGAPVLRSQVVDDMANIADVGSDAAALLPDDRVLVTIPMDPSGIGQVAYGIQDGDYVDVIYSYLFIDVDETFQTRLPNNVSIITRLETGELAIGAPRQGRQEPSTLSPEGVLVSPSESAQRPRLVTNYAVRDAYVMHVGEFPPDGKFFGLTPTPLALDAPPAAPGADAQEATPVPTATPYVPLMITLGVTPQDALVLTWAVDAQIPITFVLRPAGVRAVTDSEPVTLEYMVQNFEIPDPLPFSLEPPITSIRRFDVATLYDFLGSSVTSSEGQ